MKSTLKNRVNLILFSIFVASSSFAQKADFTNESAFKFTSNKIINEFPSPAERIDLSGETANVNGKVLQSFNSEYQHAEKVVWSRLKKNFLAKFKNGQMETETLFNSNGKILYSIDYGIEKDLPKDLTKLVYSTYPEHVITGVSKVTRKKRQIWVITTAGKHNDIKARIEGGQIEEVETIQKKK